MKKGLLLFLFLHAFVSAFSQSHIQPVVRDSVVGKDYRTNLPLKAREFDFGMPVYRIHPLPEQESFAVMLRKKKASNDFWTTKGELLLFNAGSKEVKWRKKFKYAQARLLVDGNVLLEQRAKKVERLDPENGMPMWTAQSIAYKVYPELDRALGYDVQSGLKTLHGLDLKTGKVLWQRNVPGYYGWENLDMLDAETALIKSSGIHSVKVTDGTGWDVDRTSHSEKVDMKQVGMAVLLGVATGVASGGAYYSMPNGSFTNLFLEISSNLLYDNNTVFFAAKNKISSYTLTGERLWTTELNEKQTSKSHLFRDGDVVYMINTGHAIKFGARAPFGTPFVAAFDAGTGKQLFMKMWDERKNFFADYLIQGRDIYLLSRNKLEIHELSPEGLSKKAAFEMPDKMQMKEFVSDFQFIKKDSVCSQLSLDTTHYYIYSEQGELLKFNNEFLALEKLDDPSLYRTYFQNKDFRFLANSKETLIVDRQTGQIAAQCPVPFMGVKAGSKLYYRKKNNNIVEVDISPFLNNEIGIK